MNISVMPAKEAKNSFLNMLWINKENKSFDSVLEVDNFIHNLRKEWI